MGWVYQEAQVGGSTYKYGIDANNRLYEFELPQGRFTLSPWNWGEKNKVLDECITWNDSSQDFLFDVAKFNELVLLSTIKRTELNGQELPMDLAQIHNLEARLGDLLLDLCGWVNRLDGDKPHPNFPPINIDHEVDSVGAPIVTANDYTFKFRTWTWGEKNSILSQCAIWDDSSQQMRISTQRFNELMLLTTLAQVKIKEKTVTLTLEFLQNLDARLGDVLLETAQEFNEISLNEKKN